MVRKSLPWLCVPVVMVSACAATDSTEVMMMPPPGPASSPLGFIPKDVQRPGDPQKGYRALLNEGYVGCGIPYSVYSRFFGPAPAELQLPGREGKNATLPYYVTAFTTARGVEVVAPNCLSCHGGSINGKIIPGLGNASLDLTDDPSGAAKLLGGLVTDPVEHAEWEKFVERMSTVAPYSTLTTIGPNTADNIAGTLFAHRDRKTLSWSKEPLLPLPSDLVAPVDVPPWWRMKKKNAMFYNGGGRGDHARIMMTASTLCVDSVAEAEAIDAYFPDVRAYIYSLEAPPYPYAVDTPLAERGRAVFEESCARCHGSYGAGGSYPNLVIGVEEVGTDSLIVSGTAQFAGPFVTWFNESFYGQKGRLAPAPGYVAPPLDGIWATAPYLHNASVPTLATLLDSSKRPRYFKRSYTNKDFDEVEVGWRYTAVDHGQTEEPSDSVAKTIYDTRLPGYGNGGHTYGDSLSTDERKAVIEYLKTL